MIDAVLFRMTDSWFWVMTSSAIFALASLSCGLLIWAFKPTNVNPNARTFFHVTLGAFVFRRWFNVILVSTWGYDWPSAFFTWLMAISTTLLLLSVFKAIERDRAAKGINGVHGHG